MCRLKISLSFILLFFSLRSFADWGVNTQMSGYLGSYSLAAAYISDNEAHNFDIGVGMSPGIVENDVYQFNMKYVFSPFTWDPDFLKGFHTNIIGTGVIAMRCLCSQVFIRNLDIYPEKNYYDETAWRFAWVLEHKFARDKFELYWDWVLLDQIMIATFNNREMRKRPFDYWSAGLGIRFFPEW